MEKNKYYLSCDCGSEYIKIILFETDLINKETKAVKHICGRVDEADTSPARSERCIKSTLRRLTEKMNIPQPEEVYASINSSKLVSMTVRHSLAFEKPTVITKEILDSLSRKTKKNLNKNEELVYISTNRFLVDGKMEVSNPMSMEAEKIEAEYFLIKTDVQYLDETDEIFSGSGLKISSIIPGIVAQGEILLTPQEKNLGSCLVDVGSSTTDVICYHNGHTALSFSLDLGIKDVIGALSSYLQVKYKDAYYIFGEYTNLLQSISETEIRYIDVYGESQTVSVGIFNKIIEDIFRQMFTTVKNILSDNDINIHALTVTGGISEIQGIKPLISQCFNIHRVKTGKLNDVKHSSFTDNKWATCFGMMQIQKDSKAPQTNRFYNIIYNIKTFLDNILK